MSKESKDVKVRKAIGKWQQVFIWIIALAFVAGIVLWAFAVNYTPGAKKVRRTLEESVAYITENGQALKNQTYWVFPEEVEQRFGEILSAYGNPQLDTYIEVPYVKALITIDLLNTKSLLYYAEANNIKPDKNEVSKIIKEEIDKLKKDTQKTQEIKTRYGSLSNYEKELKRQKEEELTIKAVKEKLAGVTEKEVTKYYEENKENIINEYTSADVDYVVLESKEKVDNFIKVATEKGFAAAASETSVSVTPYTLKKGVLPQELEKEIFDATSTLVSLPYNESYFVFNIKGVQKVDSYESFKSSNAYETVKTNLINERFAENFKKWKEEKKVSFEVRDDVYSTWYEVLTTESKDLLTVYKKMYEKLFDEAGNVRTDLPIEQKTAFLVVADRIMESTDTALEIVKSDVKEFEKKLVQSVYEITKGSSKEILRRMKEYNPD
ncbi:MAG: peptidyl-prolyl cis-trans isomerase, partial [Fervidobacterium sp.]